MYRIFNLNGKIFNVDNDEDANNALKSGAVEITDDVIVSSGIRGFENLVSPNNTSITNGTITFIRPIESNGLLFILLRAERDRRLAATDFLLMPDYPLSDDQRAVVQAYRQALRDLPAKSGAPWDGGGEATPWPELPAGLKA